MCVCVGWGWGGALEYEWISSVCILNVGLLLTRLQDFFGWIEEKSTTVFFVRKRNNPFGQFGLFLVRFLIKILQEATELTKWNLNSEINIYFEVFTFMTFEIDEITCKYQKRKQLLFIIIVCFPRQIYRIKPQ